MNEVWTLAEHHGTSIKEVSWELLARGRGLADSLGSALCSVVLGNGIPEEELKTLFAHGADRVYVVSSRHLAEVVCETYANTLAALAEEYKPDIILAAATTTGRSVLPRLAVQLHTGLTADCTELAIEEKTGNLLQTRPAIGGNIMATIKTPDHRPQMATVRPKSTRPLPADPARSGETVRVEWDDAWYDSRVTILQTREEEEGESIAEAEIVVAGGRGMKKKENFHMIEDIAHALGGKVGATRDAVDRGWETYPHQVGLSGKTISPRLYIGIGISGSVQHLAGIKTSGCIVAINSDEHANLLQVADFALVGDLFEIVPELLKRLEKKGGAR